MGQNKRVTINEKGEDSIGLRMYADSAFPYFFSSGEFLEILRRDPIEILDQPQDPQHFLSVFGF
jgi:hypothetical protein